MHAQFQYGACMMHMHMCVYNIIRTVNSINTVLYYILYILLLFSSQFYHYYMYNGILLLIYNSDTK